MAYGLGVAKGMLTTISHLIKPPVTIQYPEERLDMPIWTRGRPAPHLRGRHRRAALHRVWRLRAGVPGRRHQDRAAPQPDQGQGARSLRHRHGRLHRVRAVRRGVSVPCDHHGAGLRDGGDLRPHHRPGLRHVRPAHRRHTRDRRGHGAHPGRQTRAARPGGAGAPAAARRGATRARATSRGRAAPAGGARPASDTCARATHAAPAPARGNAVAERRRRGRSRAAAVAQPTTIR